MLKSTDGTVFVPRAYCQSLLAIWIQEDPGPVRQCYGSESAWIRIILGSWIRTRIRIKVKSMIRIRIRIKVKKWDPDPH